MSVADGLDGDGEGVSDGVETAVGGSGRCGPVAYLFVGGNREKNVSSRGGRVFASLTAVWGSIDAMVGDVYNSLKFEVRVALRGNVKVAASGWQCGPSFTSLYEDAALLCLFNIYNNITQSHKDGKFIEAPTHLRPSLLHHRTVRKLPPPSHTPPNSQQPRNPHPSKLTVPCHSPHPSPSTAALP
jgi:hypothetical protein